VRRRGPSHQLGSCRLRELSSTPACTAITDTLCQADG
jgi:hypothetical protein